MYIYIYINIYIYKYIYIYMKLSSGKHNVYAPKSDFIICKETQIKIRKMSLYGCGMIV